MRWRIGSCLLAAALASCAGAQQPGSPEKPDAARARSIAMAIPRDVKFALLLEKPWARTAIHREVARRLGVARQYGAAMLAVRGTLGFDPMDPAEVRAHGFDDQGGIGLYARELDGGPVLALGVSDPELAQKTLHGIFDGIEERETGEKLVSETRAVPSGDGVTVFRRTRGDFRAAYVLHGGFVYLRLPGAGDPIRDLAAATAIEPQQTLDREPGYRALHPADAILYAAELPSQHTWLPGGPMAGRPAVALDMQPDRIGLRVHARIEPDSSREEAQPTPAPRVDLAAELPAYATLWVHISCSTALAWNELTKNTPDRRRVAEAFQAIFGATADRELRSSFTGNFAIGLYPSAARLRGSSLDGSPDSPAVVLVAELAEGRENDVEAILDRGTENLARKTQVAVQRRVAEGMPLWRIAGEAIVALRGHRLLAVLPTRPSGEVSGAQGNAGPPSTGAPPRWPPEATASELGVFAGILRTDRSPLSEELRKLHADDEHPAPTHALVRATGAILDFPGLLRSVLDGKGNPGIVAANELFRRAPAFQKARLELRVDRDAVDAEMQWTLPREPLAAEAPPAVPPGQRLRTGLREARRLVKQLPDAIEPREQLVTLLLEAAAGTTAREEARRVISLAPGDARAQLLLARVLEHDVLGRRWRVGLDSEGAEAALRKAVEIDPKNFGARVDLVLLLEHDRGGQRDFSEARIRLAAAEVRTIRDAWARGDLKGQLDERLLEAEFFAELWNEVVTDAQRMPQSAIRDAYALAARAVSQGTQAAVDESKRIDDAAARAKAVANAASWLDIARRYAEAARLERAAASVVADASALSRRGDQDSKVSRVEAPRSPPSNPASLVEEAAIEAYDPRVPAVELARFLASDSPVPKRAARGALLAVTAGRRAEALANGVDVANVRDYFHSLSDFRVEGDRAAAFRVELRSDSVSELWWLVDDGGRAKVLCRAACTGPLGGRALTLVETGKPDLARRVLDQARDALPKEEARRDAHQTLFASIWNGDRERVRVAAAVAAADGPQSARAIPILRDLVKSVDAPLRDRLRVAVGFAQLNAKDADSALQSIAGIDPAVVPQARDVRISALVKLKRFAEAERAIDEWLARAPDDPFALLYAMRHGSLVDDLARIERPARKLIASKKAFVIDAANDLAWAKFCHGQVDEDAVKLAEVTSRSGSPAALNTLATLYAESGRFDEARQTVLKSIDANGAFRDDGQMELADRYALARIWEGYGLDDLAAPEYRALSLSKDESVQEHQCIVAAARRRLSALSPVQ